jgi:hypothetical protein
MSKQWQATTRGGHDYRITGKDPEFKNLIRGAVEDSGVTINVQWTESGRSYEEYEHPYDLIPIEPEATSPAKVRVDLALATYVFRAAVVELQQAESQKDRMAVVLSDAFAASGKTEVVVKIDGEHYYFWTEETKVFFRKIEVL